jgi:hypothetical protein
MIPSRLETLKLLKAELEFVESGGYGRSSRTPWRAPYIFEDSPSCPNSSDRSRSHLCEECWLIEFVPPDLRGEQVPCRFVDLNGVTVDSLYRCGTQMESEETLRRWLRERIRELEAQLQAARELETGLS